MPDPGKNSYPSQLAAMLGAKYAVKNFGVSGATLMKNGDKPYWKTGHFKPAHDFKPNIVIIKLGTNDTKPQNWKLKSEFVADYIDLIKSFKKLNKKTKIWICYPVPAYPGQWGITDKTIKEVLPLLGSIATKAKVKKIDLHTALSNKKEMFPDTVHPNIEGSKLIAQHVYTAITGKKAEK